MPIANPQPRFLGLLIALLGVLVFSPFFYEYMIMKTMLDYLIITLLLVAIYTISKTWRTLLAGFILFLPLVVFQAILSYHYSQMLHIISYSSMILFFISMITIMSRYILSKKTVNSNLVYGALCIYLLIGITWAMAYSLLELCMPGSFIGDLSILTFGGSDSVVEAQTHTFLYFSFTTLTTLGYGDLVPILAPARSLAITESIIGQFYIAVVIARMIGLQLHHQSDTSSG